MNYRLHIVTDCLDFVSPFQCSEMDLAMLLSEARDGNRSRKRMKEEILCLRDTVDELEAKLLHLRTSSRDSVESVSSPAPASLSLGRQIVDAAWKDIAQRQQALRYRAEVENANLRELVEDQIRLCKQLERLLHKREHASANWFLSRSASIENVPHDYNPLDDATVLSAMKAKIPALINQANTIYSNASHWNKTTGAFRTIELKAEAHEGMFVEVAERRILPFDLAELSHAIVQQFAGPLTARHNELVPDAEGFIVQDSSVQINTSRYSGSLRSKSVICKQEYPDHTLIVFTALSDPSTFNNLSLGGLYARYDGWCRICEEPRDENSTDTVGETLVYCVAYPEAYNTLPDSHRKVGALTNFLLSSFGFQMDLGNEIMDNVLLDRAKARSTRVL